METILPDVLKHKLEIVFCGTAAGDKSANRKAYYAGRGNLFYSTLASCGYTPRLLRPEEYLELLNWKIGLTDLAQFTHGIDSVLKDEDFDTQSFTKKILLYQPKLVCFNGKKAAQIYFGLLSTKDVSYGLQDKRIDSTKLYVAPSTSFSARKFWDEDIWWKIRENIK